MPKTIIYNGTKFWAGSAEVKEDIMAPPGYYIVEMVATTAMTHFWRMGRSRQAAIKFASELNTITMEGGEA